MTASLRTPVQAAGKAWATFRALGRRWAVATVRLLLPLLVRLWRRSCRVRFVDDPRPALRRVRRPYVFALWHGQQVAAVLAHDEPQPWALVSRSRDGALLAHVLTSLGVRCARGSSRGLSTSEAASEADPKAAKAFDRDANPDSDKAASKGADKGGGAALAQLVEMLAADAPAIFAVDGPRGPAGTVHGGALALAVQTGAAVLPVAIVAGRAHTLRASWDQTQLPWPGTTLQVRFGPPLLAPRLQARTDQQAWVAAARPQLAAALAALTAQSP